VIRLVVSKRGFRRSIGIFAVVVPALSLAANPSYPQQGETQPGADAQPAAQAAPAAKPLAGDSVASRIGRLEQQFKDLQVSVGTLESLEAWLGPASRGSGTCLGRRGELCRGRRSLLSRRRSGDPDRGAREPARAARQADVSARGEACRNRLRRANPASGAAARGTPARSTERGSSTTSGRSGIRLD
jgi:hypothetical protein